jgi:hypothetical protein
VTQEAAMAEKQRNQAGAIDGAPSTIANRSEVTAKPKAGAAGTQSQKSDISKTSGRLIRRLSKQLDSARATEARRLRQSAKAHQKVDKRERQVARAAADIASIEGRLHEATTGGSATRPAPETVPTPPKAPRPTRRTASPATKPATGPARKPAPARKSPTSPKPSTSA